MQAWHLNATEHGSAQTARSRKGHTPEINSVLKDVLLKKEKKFKS